jgi:hypothetical protein
MLKQLQCVLGFLLLALSPVWAAKMYKWTDENGVVYYSDKLPPETVDKEHQEINSRGVTTKAINREKTAAEKQEEAVAKALAEAEKRRVAEEEAQQRARDELLLNTFTTERDLLLARQDRLDSIDSIINLTTSNNASMEQQANAAHKRIETLQKAGKDIPENVTKQLESLEGQLTKNRSFIQIKSEERIKLEQKFDADIRRYRELKGMAGEASTAEQQAADQATQAAINIKIEPPAPPTANGGNAKGAAKPKL